MKKSVLIGVALCAFAANTVWAEGGYLGVQYGIHKSEDADMGNLGFVGGFQINDNFSIELQLTNTINEEDLDSDISLESNSQSIFASFKSAEDIYFKGRLGLTKVEYEMDVLGYGFSDDETGLSYGIGLGFKIGEQGSLELDYTQYPKLDTFAGEEIDADGSFLSLGLLFHI